MDLLTCSLILDPLMCGIILILDPLKCSIILSLTRGLGPLTCGIILNLTHGSFMFRAFNLKSIGNDPPHVWHNFESNVWIVYVQSLEFGAFNVTNQQWAPLHVDHLCHLYLEFGAFNLKSIDNRPRCTWIIYVG